MDKFLNLIKNNDNKKYLIFLICIGVCFMVFSNSFSNDDKKIKTDKPSNIEFDQKKIKFELESILSNISGAGKVEVMIVFDNSYEKVLAKNTKSSVENKDDKESRTVDSNAVMIKEGNNQTPYIVKEINPSVRGVLVIAEGADNEKVKINLKNAVKTVLNIPLHKVEVLTKK